MSKILIALGGNALGTTPTEMEKIVKNTAKYLVKICKNNQIILTHGNGPQVGILKNELPEFTLDTCGSLSQAYISHYLLNALQNELAKNKIKKEVVSLLTYTVVDKNDKNFKNPTKPIGSFYKTLLEAKKNSPLDSTIKQFNKGWRRVVASPLPQSFYNFDSIKALYLKNKIVICAGGGGVPVLKNNNGFKYVEAVIDKDYSSSKLAQQLKVDKFIILTNIDNVKINYGTKDEKSIVNINIKEIEKLDAQKQFGAGSMQPKILACKEFVKNSNSKCAYIGNIINIDKVLKGTSGTCIKK